MVTPYIVVLVWIICGGIAWRVATNRNGSGPLWAVIGQVFGHYPFRSLSWSNGRCRRC